MGVFASFLIFVAANAANIPPDPARQVEKEVSQMDRAQEKAFMRMLRTSERLSEGNRP